MDENNLNNDQSDQTDNTNAGMNRMPTAENNQPVENTDLQPVEAPVSTAPISPQPEVILQPDTTPANQPVAPSVSTQTQPVAGGQQKTDTMGIISLVLAFTGLHLIGIIVGVIGIQHAKRDGISTKLSKIAVILNVIFMILVALAVTAIVLLGFKEAQKVARDTKAKSDISSVYAKLEEVYSTNYAYPAELQESSLPGIDPEALVDENGASYEYLPEGCTSVGCTSYTLRYKLESSSSTLDYDGDGYYLVQSLNY